MLFHLKECRKPQGKIPKGKKVIRILNFNRLKNARTLMTSFNLFRLSKFKGNIHFIYIFILFALKIDYV